MLKAVQQVAAIAEVGGNQNHRFDEQDADEDNATDAAAEPTLELFEEPVQRGTPAHSRSCLKYLN